MRLALSTATDDELRTLMVAADEPRWRAQQLVDAAWHPQVDSIDGVRQLPRALRDVLRERVDFCTVSIAATQDADAGRTAKLLCTLRDGMTIETVAMASPQSRSSRARATVCVSTQVGCAVGCPFCATGRLGLRRSCSAAEIVDQVRVAARVLAARGAGPVTNVVYMGMGEPLANLEATLCSLRVLAGRGGIGARRITVSTSGVVPGIEALTRAALPVTLAVSLHAATDSLRDRLVPLNRRHPLDTLLRAAAAHAGATGRRVTLEWCLIGGVNDSIEQARALRDIAWRLRAHVNVIPMNRIEGSPWGPPPAATARAFLEALRGVRTTVRDTRGGDVDGACGQLRASLEARRSLRPDGTLGAPGPLRAQRPVSEPLSPAS